MKFFVHSEIPGSSIKQDLGQPQYSYYFVLEGFRRVLEQLGEVIVVEDPGQVDELFDESSEDCLFICFSPPHRAPVGLRCPTVTVFAWEFSTIPDETWDDDPRNDWRYVFKDHGMTIALSSYSAQVVKNAMGNDFPVAGIPVPVWDKFAPIRETLALPNAIKSTELTFTGDLLDSREFSFDISETRSQGRIIPAWDGEELKLSFDFNSTDITCLNGFYAAEHWGSWSRTLIPFVELPVALSGDVRVRLEGHGYHANVDRDITVLLGSSKSKVNFLGYPTPHDLRFSLIEPASRVSFRGLRTRPPAGAEDRRTLGIGLVSLTFSRPDAALQVAEQPQTSTSPGDAADDMGHAEQLLELEGVVYTSIFNPADGRKNWVDIVTAFVYAHRDHADATLVLKMINNDPDTYIGTYRLLLSQLAPFKCRVVLVRGFLDDEQFAKLVAATSYYVNASHCEGLCLPLMEFLSSGVPAVAPDNTAMADYIDEGLAFIVKSSTEQMVWPDDPRDLFRTLRYRINWESLYEGMSKSYELATRDPDIYQAMSQHARNKLQARASVESVASSLGQFLESIDINDQ